MIMNTTRFMAGALAAALLFLTLGALAQWSPGGSMVYMGDLNLAASSFSGERQAVALGGGAVQAADVNSTTNDSATTNSTLNNSSETVNASINATSTSASSIEMAPLGASEGTGTASERAVLDLSGYSGDRTKGDLRAYTNIMYPISGARGTTTSTSGGGGGCGGCA